MKKNLLMAELEAFRTAEKEVTEVGAKITGLQGRYDSLQGLLSGKADTVKSAIRAKAKGQEDFVSGCITEGELEDIKAKVSKVREDEQDTKELIDATEKVLHRLQAATLPEVHKRLQAGKINLWKRVYELEVESLPATTKKIILQLWGIQNLSGIPTPYETFLRSLFPAPGHEELQATISTLQNDILG